MPEKIPCQLNRLRQPLKHWLGQKALSDSLGVINANINKQINATELQNALLEKANTSSDRLAKDLEEIRNYFIK